MTMYFTFIFLITTVLGINDGSMKNLSGEEIPRIQHRLVNDFQNLSESSSNGKKRQWGTPDPNAKVIALSPDELQSPGNFICNFCDAKFTRAKNLQYHLRSHGIHSELPEKDVEEVPRKKAYICPDSNCIHHNPIRALSNITAVKKHYMRKHMEKSLSCGKCLHKYALKSDLEAHKKKCKNKNYECSHCGAKYSRIEIFEIHKVKCQSQNPMPYETVHMPGRMSEVNDVQITETSTKSGHSNTSSINNAEQSVKKCNGFETSEFIGSEQFQRIAQISDSSQQHSLHVDPCWGKSIWELTYYDTLDVTYDEFLSF